jgi:hypothetical protein
MAPTVQPHLKRLSSSDVFQPDLVTQPLAESKASELPPVNNPLAVTGSSDAGFQFYTEYERDLDEFRKVFNGNMKNKPVKHDRVYVLIWTWGDFIDDLGVKGEVRNHIHKSISCK